MSSWIGGLLGGVTSSSHASSNVNVESILTKLQDPTTNEEQRKKMFEILREISQNTVHHKVIGASMGTLITCLKTERGDIDSIKDLIQTLINIMSISAEPSNLPVDSIEYFNVDLFLKDSKNVIVILNLLEEKDSMVRYHTTQLLRILLASRCDQLQHHILIAPMGIARLMDLLRETREIVRNEGLLLLLELTKSNQEIQKIVAFEGAFEILLNIIKEEGMNDGSIIVQDCLHLILNLLRNNVSNQNYYRETSCISKIPPLLQINTSDLWLLTDDKRDIIWLTLDLISLLVTGNNPATHNNQNVLTKNNILQLLCPLGLGRINSSIIRIKALLTIGDVLYGNKDNCSIFSNLSIAIETTNNSNNKESQVNVIIRLLIVALNSKDLTERNAAVRLFKCFLFENEEGQIALASTLTPVPTNDDLNNNNNNNNNDTNVGTQLLNALFSWEDSEERLPYKCYFSTIILTSILYQNNNSKDLIVRIPLEIPKPGTPIVTLLTLIMRSLTLASRLHTTKSSSTSLSYVKISFLRLLCIWLENSPASIKAFLASPSNLPFIIELVVAPATSPEQQESIVHIQGLCSLLIGICLYYNEDDDSTSQFNRSSLYSIIVQRIGLDLFLNKFQLLRKTDSFVNAEQGKSDWDYSPINNNNNNNNNVQELQYYDYEFTVFFKNEYDKIQRQIKTPKSFSKSIGDNNNNKENKASNKIGNLNNNNNINTNINNNNTASTETYNVNNNNSNSNNNTNNINNGITTNGNTNNSTNKGPTNEYHEAVLASYKELIRQQDRELDTLKKRNADLELKIKQLEETTTSEGNNNNNNNNNNNVVTKTINDNDNERYEIEISMMKERLTMSEKQIETLYEDIATLQDEKEELTKQNNERGTSNELASLSQAYNHLEKLIVEKDEKIRELQNEVNLQKDKINQLENSVKEQEQRFSSLEKEQEDLLVELANYEIENNNLKATMSQYDPNYSQ